MTNSGGKLRAALPNALTALRLVATPFIVVAILGERYRTALGIFLLAGISDGLDGVLARKLGGVTRLGAHLDPIADKVFVVAVYLALAAKALAPWWLVGVVVSRDLLILAVAGALLAAGKAGDFQPSVWGKAATTIHVITIVTLLVWQSSGWTWVEPPAVALIWLAGAATAWSGGHYAWRAWRRRRIDDAARGE